WKHAAVHQYLYDYCVFQRLLLTCIAVMCGAMPRITELAAMLYRNGETRTRNLFLFGLYCALLRQYTKSSSTTGQDKFIPHALPAFLRDILLRDLIYVRPF
ncbi:hypothetical protein FISHEDRAFT_22019, partial [Fistulina hepatica ATCC 64428]